MKSNFNEADQEDLRVTQKACVHVYQEYNKGRANPYRLYERDDAVAVLAFFESWRVVGEYKTLDAAQESARSRAIKVKDHGLYVDGKKAAMMDWNEPEREIKKFPELSANFADDDEVDLERKHSSKHNTPVPYKRP